MKSLSIKTVRGSSIEAFEQNVVQAFADGFDLYGPLFRHANEIAQVVCQGMRPYEHRLIKAVDLEDLDMQMQNLALLGFDIAFNPVAYENKILMWMHKLNERGMLVRDAVSQSLELTSSEGDEVPLQVVEEAHPFMSMLINDRAVALGEKFMKVHGPQLTKVLVVDGTAISFPQDSRHGA